MHRDKTREGNPVEAYDSYFSVHMALAKKLPQLYLQEDGCSNLGTFFCHILCNKNSNLMSSPKS